MNSSPYQRFLNPQESWTHSPSARLSTDAEKKSSYNNNEEERLIELSEDQKAGHPKEIARISDNGGFVINNRLFGSLAVARAFGDAMYSFFIPTSLQDDLQTSSSNSRDDDTLLQIVDPIVIRELGPCLLLLYGDVERTGEDDKAVHRHKISIVLKYLWGKVTFIFIYYLILNI